MKIIEAMTLFTVKNFIIDFWISSLFFSSNIAIKKLISKSLVLKAWPSIKESSNKISETIDIKDLNVNKLILFFMVLKRPFDKISFLLPWRTSTKNSVIIKNISYKDAI